MLTLDNGQTDVTAEAAGEADIDSPPSERASDDAENGLEADDDLVTLPGPTYKIDEPLETDPKAT